MANPLYGQNKFDSGQPANWKHQIAWDSWNWSTLQLQAAADTTEAKGRAGITLIDDTICESLCLGDTATTLITLPEADVGALTVFRHVAQADGAESITFTCASGDSYLPGTICLAVENNGDGFLMKPCYLQRWTQSVAISGGTILTPASGNNTITMVHTASNNQTNIGAELAFYCEEAGKWTFAFRGSELGSGAVNGSFAFSTV